MIDLSQRQHVHVVGAGGAGMSAIAQVLATMGHEVSGSDLKSSPMFERLRQSGLKMSLGHDAENVEGASALAISSAIPPANAEVVEATRLGIPVLSRADVLSAVAVLRRTVAVAGTHGKTTTASMLALVLVEAGLRPSFIIGGDVNDIGTNAAWDDGDWLVVEADESDGTFLRLSPEVALVTNVDPDHLEHYGSLESLEESFRTFMAEADTCVVSADDRRAASLAPTGALTFGMGEGAVLSVSEVRSGRSEVTFSLSLRGDELGAFSLAVPGAYNALNAAAAVGAASLVGVDPAVARRALARFAGVARRFEFRGERNGVTFVDDYAHLPNEVRAALAAARDGGFDRVVAVFQPHRYSRLASLAPAFADAFVEADLVFVTHVFAAGEAARPGVSGQLVVDAVRSAHPDAAIEYVPSHEVLLDRLRTELRAGDCCLSLEAGDLTSLPDELITDERW
jgi:UDP-N-acetylmuramate--alanine ligase